jgi:hypothetical protein
LRFKVKKKNQKKNLVKREKKIHRKRTFYQKNPLIIERTRVRRLGVYVQLQ